MPQTLLTLCLILAVTLEMRGPITSVGPLANLLTTELALTPNQYGLVASLPILAFGLFSLSLLLWRVGLVWCLLSSYF